MWSPNCLLYTPKEGCGGQEAEQGESGISSRCPGYACRTDVRASSLQKLDTWLMQRLGRDEHSLQGRSPQHGGGRGEAGEPPTPFLLSSSQGGLRGSPLGIFPGSGPRQERQPRRGAQLHLRLTSLPQKLFWHLPSTGRGVGGCAHCPPASGLPGGTIAPHCESLCMVGVAPSGPVAPSFSHPGTALYLPSVQASLPCVLLQPLLSGAALCSQLCITQLRTFQRGRPHTPPTSWPPTCPSPGRPAFFPFLLFTSPGSS